MKQSEIPEAQYLGQTVEVLIDRPIGSEHPETGMVYELNYGYLPDTIGGDGMEIDAYVLGPMMPVKQISGTVIAVIVRHDDVENKLIVAAGERQKYSSVEVLKKVWFQEQYFDVEVWQP